MNNAERIAQIRATADAECARLTREADEAARLPEGIASMYAHKQSTHAAYNVPSLRAAIALGRSFPGFVPSFAYTGVFDHFRPPCLIQSRSERADWEQAEKNEARPPLECVAALKLETFRLSNDSAFQSSATLVFHAVIEGRPFEVSARILADHLRPPHYLKMRPVMNGNSHNATVARWDAPEATRLCSRSTRFSTGSGPSHAVDARFYFADWESLDLCAAAFGE